jgi:hypothetical protein
VSKISTKRRASAIDLAEMIFADRNAVGFREDERSRKVHSKTAAGFL